MSRFGKLPLKVPSGVTITISDGIVSVQGPKGKIERKLPRQAVVRVAGDEVFVENRNESKLALALQGTMKAHINNMIKGVTQGWRKELELVGSGYRAEVRGRELVLAIGYSHPVVFAAPDAVDFKVEKSKITVEGIDKDIVGQISAEIRATRKPDPYKGKGIKYIDEVIRRKAGKQTAKTA
jgi:large subunit ribosomal protein L6